MANILASMVMMVLLACIPAGVSGWLQRDAIAIAVRNDTQAQTGDPWSVTMKQVTAWPERILWIDSRHGQTINADNVKGALILHEDAWDQLLPAVLDAWDPDSKIVVFCDGGGCQASQHVAKRLREEMGMDQTYYLQGGVQSLRQFQAQIPSTLSMEADD